MKRRLPVTIVAATLLCGPSIADTAHVAQNARASAPPAGSDTAPPQNRRFTFGAGLSLFGATLEAGYRVTPRFGLRVPVGMADVDFDTDIEGRSLSTRIDVRGAALVGDFYPSGSGLRLSAGVGHASYVLDGTAEDIAFEDTGITTGVDIRAENRRKIMPLAGIGYDLSVGRRGSLSLDAGIMLGNGFSLDASDPSGRVSRQEVDEEISEVRDALDGLDMIPVVNLRVAFRF